MSALPTRRQRDARGLVLPSWLVALSAALVVLGLVGFAVTGDPDPDADPSAGPGTSGSATASPGSRIDGRDESTGSADRADGGEARADGSGGEGPRGNQAGDGPRTAEPVERRTAYVEVYNNSTITGLAGSTAATLQDSGWQVVTTDNWYGEIPANTVYYPADLRAQAELLAGDLGIDRTMPAVDPMGFDRLTVILTSET